MRISTVEIDLTYMRMVIIRPRLRAPPCEFRGYLVYTDVYGRINHQGLCILIEINFRKKIHPKIFFCHGENRFFRKKNPDF